MSLDGFGNGPNTGIQGQPGPRGRSIFTGMRVPQPTDGEAGDFYFDKLHRKFYGPKLENIGWDLDDWIFIGIPSDVIGQTQQATIDALAATAAANAKIEQTEAARQDAITATTNANAAIVATQAATAAANAVVADAASILAAKDVALAAQAAAEAAAATIVGLYTANPPDTDPFYSVDGTNRKTSANTKNGWLAAALMRAYNFYAYRTVARRMQIEDRYGTTVGEITYSTSSNRFFISDPTTKVASSIRGTGVFAAAVSEFYRSSIRKLFSGSVTIEDPYGNSAGRITYSTSRALISETDPTGKQASALRSDSSTAFTFAEIFSLIVKRLRTSRLFFEDAYGTVYTSIVRSISPFPSIVDGNGVTVGGFTSEGLVKNPQRTDAGRFAGGHFAVNSVYMIEARRRVDGNNGHDIWRVALNGGGQLKLSADNELADCVSPEIVSTPTGDYVVYIKRVGRRQRRVAVPIAGGAEVPLHGSNATVMVGDSYVHPSLTAAVNAVLPNTRPIIVFGSGGCTLKGDRAALLGGTVSYADATGTNNYGRGGLTTYVDNGDGTVTYPGMPQYRDRTLIMMQGALENPNGAAELIGFYKDILNWMTPVHKRMVIMQASVPETATPSDVTAFQNLWTAISTDPVLAGYCTSTYDYMRVNGGGGTLGSGGGQVWALNNYALPTDHIHPSATGYTNLGARIALGGLVARNW